MTLLLPNLPGHSQIFLIESFRGVHCQVVDKMAIFKRDGGVKIRGTCHTS